MPALIKQHGEWIAIILNLTIGIGLMWGAFSMQSSHDIDYDDSGGIVSTQLKQK